ncbi:CGNR zinc finger domain-containing protein [Herbiconiux sp. CPCC 205763]|uniref:CGNR zinc finger domain-containing protein n=1 Tax=Herbiconiux aconitum TaxID=2970913 RepID=A0ABT2GMF7_9MICO|nr:CGNR zinc finger domain-containing protein [Herbiconiux aconitum]MCS5717306.1 CGNR zinc finger domain-containing protein [Herbiconiux aconitum]
MEWPRASEEALLTVLNSAPRVDGAIVDGLADPQSAGPLLESIGGAGTDEEALLLAAARDELQAVIRGQKPAAALAPFVESVIQRPSLTAAGVGWSLDGPADALPAARAVLEWSRVTTDLPGRLRPCENPDCTKFLIDHSKPNSARWCSMAGCGNRMKASRYRASRRAEEALAAADQAEVARLRAEATGSKGRTGGTR